MAHIQKAICSGNGSLALTQSLCQGKAFYVVFSSIVRFLPVSVPGLRFWLCI